VSPHDRAVAEGLKVLAGIWPNKFSAAKLPEALPHYARALGGVTLHVIPRAVDQWCAREKFGPTPAELGQLARAIDRAERPAVVARPQGPESPFPRPPQADDIERLSLKARHVLRSWTLVSEAWAVAWEVAPGDDARDGVRLGQVPPDVWDDIISQVANGRVARTPGPLKRAIGDAA